MTSAERERASTGPMLLGRLCITSETRSITSSSAHLRFLVQLLPPPAVHRIASLARATSATNGATRSSGPTAGSGSREVGVGGFGLGATGDVGIGNPFLGGGGPRGIQLAAKFTF